MKRQNFLMVALAVAPWTIATGALAQHDDSTAAILDCPAISDGQARLACFDREIVSLKAAVEMVASQAEPAQLAQAAETEDDFGAERLSKSIVDRQQERKDKGEIDEITAAVIESGRNAHGKTFFILDNGQVWRQNNSDTTMIRIPKKMNATVTIKKKSFGGYRLTVDQLRRTASVTRIK